MSVLNSDTLRRHRRSLIAALAVLSSLVLVPVALAVPPNQFVLEAQFGHEVNKTKSEESGTTESERDVCTSAEIESVHLQCQLGKRSALSGGYFDPEGVAVGPASAGGDLYVADALNGRVQVLSSSGHFLFMVGWEVDVTKSKEGKPQAERDICTAASGDVCGAAKSVSGGPSLELGLPTSIAVDQKTGAFYVLDLEENRVEKYSATGSFEWMIGGEVNKTEDETAGSTEAQRNLCSAVSGNECTVGVPSTGPSSHGAFLPHLLSGDLLAVGGPEDLIYVGDQGRIQRFDPVTGAVKPDISLTSLGSEGYVSALAVDPSGNSYVVYSGENESLVPDVHVIDSAGSLTRTIVTEDPVTAVAVDPFGRLAIIEERGQAGERGVLLEASSGDELSRFGVSKVGATAGIAFNPEADESKDELYVAASALKQEIEMYLPVPVAVPVTGPCTGQTATSVTFTGSVNPEEVSETNSDFQYGSGLARSTPVTPLPVSNKPLAVQATVTGLKPNEAYPYRVVVEDKNYKPVGLEEPLAGKTLTCNTLYVAPAMEGTPQSYFVTSTSADLFAELNPENADTVYRFEYGSCTGPETLEAEECSDVETTPVLESSEYRSLTVGQSVAGLRPGAIYRYRLVAESKNKLDSEKKASKGAEATFTTAVAPNPTAATGPVSAVGSTTAALSGTVDPDGVAVSYAFEVGIYRGAETDYGVIASGSVPAGEATSVGFGLSGLQPGTSYAYRIVLFSPYIEDTSHSLVGTPVVFTTAGLPTVLFAPSPASMLPLPPISFPKSATKPKPKAKKVKKKTKKKVKHSKAKKAVRKQHRVVLHR